MDSVIHLLNNWDLGSIFSRHGIKKISGFSANDSGFIAYSKISTLESGLKKLRIRMPDSPDACGRKPYPERISCGFKNIRIRVSQITCHQIYKMRFNTPNKFFVSFLFGIAHMHAFCIVVHFIGKLRFAYEYAQTGILNI